VRGIFFSLDVLFAVIVAGVLITGFYFYLPRSQEDIYPKLYLSKIANDALSVLDKNGTLQTLNQSVINNSLIGLLPSNIAWRLNITSLSSPYPPVYCSVPTGSMISRYPADAVEQDYVTGRRIVINITSATLTNCSLAELRVWLR